MKRRYSTGNVYKPKKARTTRNAKVGKLISSVIDSVCSQPTPGTSCDPAKSLNSSMCSVMSDVCTCACHGAVLTQLQASEKEITRLVADVKNLRSTVVQLKTHLDFLLSFCGIQQTVEAAKLSPELSAEVAQQNAQNCTHDREVQSSGPAVSATVSTATPSADVTGSGTLTAAAKVRPSQSTQSQLCQNLVSAVYVDLRDKFRRANNIVINGLPITAGVTDKDVVIELISSAFQIQPTVRSCRRLGKSMAGKVQPLLVTLGTQDEAEFLINNAKTLRSSADADVRSHVFINADLTPAESRAMYEIRCRRRAQQSAMSNRRETHTAQTHTSVDTVIQAVASGSADAHTSDISAASAVDGLNVAAPVFAPST